VSPNSRKRAEDNVKRQHASAAAAAQQRRNRRLIWGGVVIVVLLAVLVAVVASGGDDNSASAKTTKFETHAVTVTGTPLPQYDDTKYTGNDNDPAIGKTIPTLAGVSVFDGTPVTIKPTGKPQAIIFVAHWCPHCQREVPELVTLAKDGVFDGVDVTAVATGTSPDADNYPPSAWLKRVDWPFPVLADSPQGTAAQAYGLSAYPYFVLVDADGKVAARATGEVTTDAITANIKALKAGTPLPLLASGASSAS
jgi:cytochrome c biogenesis protein CcmG, thiol:disulfide interchange protein DsbE